jgi:hypothetical protein
MLRPGALLEIFYFSHTVAVRLNNNGTLLFATDEDDVARLIPGNTLSTISALNLYTISSESILINQLSILLKR